MSAEPGRNTLDTLRSASLPGASRGLGGGLRASTLISAVLATAGALLLVVAGWWIYALVLGDSLLLPQPAEVAHRFWTLVTSSKPYPLAEETWASLQRILIGWGAGIVAGVAVGAAMASNRWIRLELEPLIEISRPIPPLAFAPLLIIWFGIGELPKVLVIYLTAFPVIAISTYSAVLGIDERWKLAARSLGASRAYLLRRVIIPGAFPGILVGIRLASGLSWSALVAAEIIASTEGLGWMILQAGVYLQTTTVFVGIVAIGAMAYLMDRILRGIEYKLVPWRGRAT